MRIIGCDLHARQQTLAMLDTTTGEVVEVILKHEGDNVREFYSSLPRPVRVAIEATGSMQWFLNLMEELGIECLVGHPAQIRAAEPRKQKNDRRDAGSDSETAGGRPLSGNLVTFQGATGSAVLVAASSSVGTDADASPKCAAVDCLGEWSTARSRPVEPRRTKQDRIVAAGAPYRLSAERVAGNVREVRSGNREAEPTRRGASRQTSRGTAADEAIPE